MNQTYDIGEVVAVAKSQQTVLWLFLALLGTDIAMAATGQPMIVLLHWGLSIALVVFAYKTAKSLKLGAPWAAIFCLLPFIGLILLISLMFRARRVLENQGIRVGLMGANQDDLQNFSRRAKDSIPPAL